MPTHDPTAKVQIYSITPAGCRGFCVPPPPRLAYSAVAAFFFLKKTFEWFSFERFSLSASFLIESLSKRFLF